MQNELIIISEYCAKCNIDPLFIELLQENNLIEIYTEGEERYLSYSQLPEIERCSRLYYDLSINIEGIDVIRHLLIQMEDMQREINELRNRLDLFRDI